MATRPYGLHYADSEESIRARVFDKRAGAHFKKNEYATARRALRAGAIFAVTAGLALSPVAATAAYAEGAAATQSATVSKADAEAALARLGAAPAGKRWSWVVDREAGTRTVTDEPAYDEQVTYYKTSDGREFADRESAEAHAGEASVTVTVTGTATVYRTSDGESFKSQAEAEAHVKEATKTVTVTGSVTAHLTSDGQSFATEAEAAAHAKEATKMVTVSAATRTVHHEATYKKVVDKPAWDETVAYYKTSDGKEFGTQAEADAHAEQASVSVMVTGSTTTYRTSDGQGFGSKAEAEAHAKAASRTVTVTGSATTYKTSDGQGFGTQAEAEAHARSASKTVTVTETTKIVHHEAVTHRELVHPAWDEKVEKVILVYDVSKRNPDGTYTTLAEFYTEKEQQDFYNALLDRQHSDPNDHNVYTTGVRPEKRVETVHHDATYKIVVDKPAWDEPVTYYKTSDDKSFDTRAEAEAHAKQASVFVTVTGSETTYKTSDGKSFGSKVEAEAHAKQASVTVTVTGSTTTYQTSDGQSFGTKAEAEGHAKAATKTVTVSSATKTVHHEATYKTVVDKPAWDEKVTYYETSDGKSFDTKMEADAHAKQASVTVTVAGSETTWRTSDGQSFKIEAEAKAHAKAASVTVAVTGPATVHTTSDGKSFATEAEAEAHAKDATKVVAVEEATKTVHHDAVTHEEPVPEAGHWVLADAPAEAAKQPAAEQKPAAKQAATKPAARAAAVLPQTGDASGALVAVATASGVVLMTAGAWARLRGREE